MINIAASFWLYRKIKYPKKEEKIQNMYNSLYNMNTEREVSFVSLTHITSSFYENLHFFQFPPVVTYQEIPRANCIYKYKETVELMIGKISKTFCIFGWVTQR